jgi:hypothetical protein
LISPFHPTGVLTSSLFAAAAGTALLHAAPAKDATHVRLHWSQPLKAWSPDHAWELTVSPVLNAQENRTTVVVRRRGVAHANVVLTLRRDADAYWCGDGRMLIIDAPVADSYDVLLFRRGRPGRVTRLRAVSGLDTDMRNRLRRALGPGRDIVFYLPTFASWAGSRLTLMLGGTTTRGASGLMTPFCFRVAVDTRTARVAQFTGVQRPVQGSQTCRIFP